MFCSSARSLVTAIFILWAGHTVASAQGLSLASAGARVGASPTSNAHDFHQIDAFLDLNLPWQADLGRAWRLQARLDFSAGWLGSPAAETAVLTVGPSLLLRHGNFPLSLEGGSSPTVLSEPNLGPKNFGEPFQFTSHIGLNLDLTAHIRIGYRFSHMSNAGLSIYNPGLNLHMFQLSYLF